jgi:hypothetical protein
VRRHVLALLVLVVTASLAVRQNRVEKTVAAATQTDRVDMGVTLCVVRQSADGKKVSAPSPDAVVRIIPLGGMVEIGKGGARYVGPSENPVVWMCSEAQAPLILHDGTRLWSLIQGSEGAGKSVALVMWSGLRVLENVGRDVTGGLTVPTGPRFRAVKKEIKKLWPKHWYRWRERDRAFVFHAGPQIQVISAVQRSEEGGSPLQGDSLEWCGSDELQDSFALEADIMSRGRGSDRYLRLCTSTSKDYSEWRTYRDIVRSSSEWTFTRMLGMESPFVDRDFWERIRRSGTVTEREWNRRYRAMDVGPEKQVYYSWRREFEGGKPAGLRAIPANAVDITAETLRAYHPNIGLLVGHDPGLRQNVSVFLKAFRLPGRDTRPRWYVVDEITSPESTVHAHAQHVLKRAREQWNCNGLDRTGTQPDPRAPQVLVRIDPHTRGGGDSHPGPSVGMTWRSLGMIAKAAAYKPGSADPAQINRRDRIDLVNTLLSATDAVGEVRRLFVAIRTAPLWPAEEADGGIAAPKLVKALETMEFNAAGKAETEAKDSDDLSHWPAALGYALIGPEGRLIGMKHEVAA